MKKIGIFVAVLSFCLMCMSQGSLAGTQRSITYKNQRGSIMVLRWIPGKRKTGMLRGTFTTAVGDCKSDVGVPVPLEGFYNGNALAVVVNFPHCKQVVAMTGNVSRNKATLSTLWLDARPSKDPNHKDWKSNLIGTDFYKKVG